MTCAQLEGEYYAVDRMYIFNMVVSYTTGQPPGDLIKTMMKNSDGRQSMETLRIHFSGEGKATQNLAEYERLNES